MVSEQLETVYCVKYALTEGIIKVEGYERESGRFSCPSRMHQSFVKSEWDRDPQKAVEKAEDLRQRKIKSVKKQLAKLGSLTFETPE